MRLGFFGGTFDPPHYGHLAIALAAAHRFALERVLMAPTGRQPLKKAGPEASYTDRLTMVELLCRTAEGLRASNIDAPDPDGKPNYTVDTITRLRSMVGSEDAIFSIIGADAFLTFAQWREPGRLLELAEWVVVSRPGSSLRDLEKLGLSDAQRKKVHLLEDVNLPVSATEVRARLQRGESVDDLVPQEIIQYIRENRLYGTRDHSEDFCADANGL